MLKIYLRDRRNTQEQRKYIFMTNGVDLFSVHTNKWSVVSSSGLGGTVCEDSGIGCVNHFTATI
jgi:hypothetical protein